MRWAGLLLLLAGPALADPALISFEFAEETIVATGDDIQLAKPSLDSNGQPALDVRLHTGFDSRFAGISRENIGRVLTIRICGKIVIEPVVQSQVSTARFLITGISAEEASRLADLLRTKTCSDQPLG